MGGLIVLATMVLPIVGFAVGVLLARGGRVAGLTAPEKKELNRLRHFEADVLGLAHEHLAYGDALAPKIVDLGRKRLG